MKAVIGQYYKTPARALKRAEELKQMWKGRVAFVAVGNNQKGYIVISETAARNCGLKVPYRWRKYEKTNSTPMA